MKKESIEQLVELAKAAALEAGRAVLAVYNSDDFGIEAKSDNSPLTRADRASHQVIVRALGASGLPVLSEEGKDIDYKERAEWGYFWLIDPLDGTREFIKRNGEFTVNIALIKGVAPAAGVVYAPVQEKLYWGIADIGAFLNEKGVLKPLDAGRHRRQSGLPVRIVASRSHLNPETEDFISRYLHAEIVSMGSSLKLMALAEGTADVYPRFGPTMEWDTAAAQAVLEAAGGTVTDETTGRPLAYNKSALLNNFFVAKASGI